MKDYLIKIFFLVLVCCMEVTGCAKNPVNSDIETVTLNNEILDIESIEYDITNISKGRYDFGSRFMIDQDLFVDELALDGNGGKNDSICLTSYKNLLDIDKSYVLLKVTLNQNEIIEKRFTGFHKKGIIITHGNLFSENTEGFVIRLRYYGSNYGASDIYVYEIAENNGHAELIEKLTLKDSEGEIDSRKDPGSCFYELKDELVFDGQTYFIEKLSRYGIKVEFYIEKDDIPAYAIYWEDDSWKLFMDENFST